MIRPAKHNDRIKGFFSKSAKCQMSPGFGNSPYPTFHYIGFFRLLLYTAAIFPRNFSIARRRKERRELNKDHRCNRWPLGKQIIMLLWIDSRRSLIFPPKGDCMSVICLPGTHHLKAYMLLFKACSRPSFSPSFSLPVTSSTVPTAFNTLFVAPSFSACVSAEI